MKIQAYNYTQAGRFTFVAKPNNGLTGKPIYLGFALPARTIIKQLWLIVQSTVNNTVVQVGTVANPTAIFTSNIAIALLANTNQEQLQSTGVNFTAGGGVYLSFGTNAVTQGSMIIQLDYTIID